MRIIPSIPYCTEIPDYFKLGETQAEIQLSNIEENKNAALSLAEQARYRINIFTHDLENSIYNNNEFENHITNLVIRHPGSQIRIIVEDSTKAIKNGHCLIRISQKLTSSISIKNPGDAHKNNENSFMTVDGTGMLYRLRNKKNNYEASVNFMSPQRTNKLDIFFNEAWKQGFPDRQVRRLFI